jgi:hypothetical protein
VQCRGQRDEGNGREKVGDPHRADGLGDLHGQIGVESTDWSGAVDLLVDVVAQDKAGYVYLRLAALGTAHSSSLLIVMALSGGNFSGRPGG